MKILKKAKNIIIQLDQKESDNLGRSLFFILKGHAPKINGVEEIYTVGQVHMLEDLFEGLLDAYKGFKE